MNGSGMPTTGQQPGHHAHVDEHLRGHQRGGPQGDQPSHRLARRRRDVEAAEEQQRVAGEQHEAADEPPRLGEYGEDEIRVTLREEGQPALRCAGHALAQELSRADRDLGLDHVVRAPEGIAKRVQEHENPFSLVFLQGEPRHRHRRQPDEAEPAQEPQRQAGGDQQGHQHGEQQQGGAEVGLLDDERRRHQGQRRRDQPAWSWRPAGPSASVSSQTAISTKHSLNSSEGCTETGPTKIHRRAPDTVRPSTKTATRAASPST